MVRTPLARAQHNREDGQSSEYFPKQVLGQSNPHIASNANAPRLSAMVRSKFMQSLDSHVYVELSRLAGEKGVSVQELIRALIIPDWISRQNDGKAKRTR